MNGSRGTSAERGPYGVLGRTCPHAATGVELTPRPSVWGNRRPGAPADPDSAPTPGSRGSQVSAFQLPKWGDGGPRAEWRGRWRTPSRPRLQRPEALSPPSALEGRRSCCVTRVLLCFRWVTLHCELHVHFVPLLPGPRRRQAGRGARVFPRRVVTACPQVAGPAHPPFTRRLLSRACSGPGSGKGEQGGQGCTGGSCQLGVPVSGRRSFGFPSRAVFAPSPCLLPLTACDKAVCEWGR